MNNDDLKTTIIKGAVMVAVLLMEYWVMQPYHEPPLAKFWQFLARLCQRIALRFGSYGLICEHNYYKAVA